jgi:hypothetical protein
MIQRSMTSRQTARGIGLARLRASALALGSAVVVLLGTAAAVSATTGPGYLLTHPLHKVTPKEAKGFIGQFRLISPHGSQVVDASMFAEFGQRPQNYLIGQVQVYAYDKSGQEGDFDATLFNWNYTGKEMTMQLVGFGGSPLIGYMVLKAGPHNTLAGTLTTAADGSKYALTFKKTALEKQPAVGPSPFKKK